MRTIFLYLFSVAVVGVMAFFGGRLFERKQLGDLPVAVMEEQISIAEPEPRKKKVKPQVVVDEPVAEVESGAAVVDTAAFVGSAVEKLATAGVSGAGQVEVLQSVSELDPAAIPEALAELQKLSHGRARQSLTAAVMSRWAEVDGAAAMDYSLTTLSHANRPAALAGALSAWSGADPEGALAWYKGKVGSGEDFEMELGVKPAYLLPTIFEGLVADDISTAYAAFSRLGTLEEKTQALDGIASANLTNEQTVRALDLAGSTLGNVGRDARLRLVEKWGQRQPAAAAAWVAEVKDPVEKSQFARSVAGTWIAYEPATAVPWLLANTQEADRANVVELATSIWVQSDPNAAAEWLGKIPKGRDSDLGVSTLARNIVGIDPETALGWAQTIENANMRRQTMLAVIGQWRVREPERAVESLKASGLPAEEIKTYLERTVPAK